MNKLEVISRLNFMLKHTNITNNISNKFAPDDYIEIINNSARIATYDNYLRVGFFGTGYVDIPYTNIKSIDYAVKSGIVVFFENGGYIATNIYNDDVCDIQDWMIDDTYKHLEDYL